MSKDRADNLIRDFFGGAVTEDTARQIDAWITADPANARRLAEFIMLDGMLLVDQKNADATAILASLHDAEQAEQAPLSPHTGSNRGRIAACRAC